MPHAVADVSEHLSTDRPKYKAAPSSKVGAGLFNALNEQRSILQASNFASTVRRRLHVALRSSPQKITRIVSLGLGSLIVRREQQRRLKQLAVLLMIRDELEVVYGEPIEVHAQDPTFTRVDESFLSHLNIAISRTPDGASLGGARSLISPNTLVYSPFLTIEAYEELLVNSSTSTPLLIGDDFNMLLSKWPKPSEERKQVTRVMRSGLSMYKRQTLGGEGFWSVEDETFPMALYMRNDNGAGQHIRSKI